MHAIVVGPGDEFPLRWTDVPDPEPGEHDVLIEVHATSVNRSDLSQRRGTYQVPDGAPPYLGIEMAGVILAAPPDLGFAAGDRVCSILLGGGYAETVAADARYLMPLADDLGFTEGGSLSEVFLTAYVNLFMEAGLHAGETALIHGGASGVGTAAIQLAHRAGVRVCVTARSEPKLAACRRLGADIAVNHRSEDWVDVIRSATGGVDVILDCIGAEYLEPNLSLLHDRGRLVIISTIGGASAEVDLGVLMRRRLRIVGSVLRTRTPAEKAAIVQGFQREFGAAVAARQILPVIHTTLPVQRAEEAHDLLERYQNIGKVVLTVR